MSRPSAKRVLFDLFRANTNLTRAAISGGIFLAFCYLIWDRFYRQPDPCVQLSENVCDVVKTNIASCIEISAQEAVFQRGCDDMEGENSACDKMKKRLEQLRTECESEVQAHPTCSEAKKALVVNRSASDRSCTHVLDTMRGLLNR